MDSSVDPWRIPLDELNVARPELFKADLIWPYFERLRAEAPVHFCRDSQYGPYWSVTRFDDILALDADHRQFSSDFSTGGVTITGTPQSGEFIPMFIQMDPPRHDQQRAAVAPRFAPTRLGELQGLIRERAASILDDLPRGETFDWVERVSKNLTGQMLATLLGLPVEERHKLIAWSDILSSPDNPEQVASPDVFYNTLADVGEYFLELWNERVERAEPGFDLISMLAHGEGTRDMGPREFVGNLVLLITGGNDTTRNSISGGLLALNQHPEEYRKLRNDPGLVANMVPEIIRWQTPLAHMARTAVEDVTLRGEQIRAGDRVILWYISGNRDPDAIPDPDRFWIDRPNARHHLSFGFGIHRCLGNRLAEMQLRILWEEILARYPLIEVVGEPERVSSCMFHGISRLPVRIPA
ncbi:MAG: cytochrome P450 [Pseudomonadales bacterium]